MKDISHEVMAVNGTAAASGKPQAPGLWADDALIDEVILTISTRPDESAGIKYLVAQFEIPDLVADAFDDARPIEAQDGRLLLTWPYP